MSEKQRIAWEDKYRTQGALWSRSHDRWFETKDDEHVLDLGCGSGKSCASLAGEITAVDFSMTALRMLLDSAPTVNPICADVAKLPFRDSQFDCVRASFILGHLDESERVATMNEVSRVLKPCGRLAIEVFSRSDGRFLRKGGTARCEIDSEDSLLHSYFDEAQIRDMLSGFEVISVNEEKWAQRIGNKESLDRSIIRAIASK